MLISKGFKKNMYCSICARSPRYQRRSGFSSMTLGFGEIFRDLDIHLRLYYNDDEPNFRGNKVEVIYSEMSGRCPEDNTCKK